MTRKTYYWDENNSLFYKVVAAATFVAMQALFIATKIADYDKLNNLLLLSINGLTVIIFGHALWIQSQ